MQTRSRRHGSFPAKHGSIVAPWLALAGLLTGTLDSVAGDDNIFADGFDPSCSQPLTCPSPAAGTSCIAGQLTDAAANQPLHATSNVFQTCGSGATGGPCDLVLTAYDVVAYEQNPGASAPLSSTETLVDGCGRFRFGSLTAPASHGVAIVASDAQSGGGHTPTATLHVLDPGQLVTGVNAVVTQSSTVMTWLFTLGIFDTTHGVILLTFSDAGTPAPGVAVAPDTSPVGAIRYFSDTDSQRLLTSQNATSTGANGSALVVNSPFQTFSGSSNGVHVCSSFGTASLPGLVVFEEVVCTF